MKINPLAITIRAKKLGVLIRDARLSSGKSIEECASAISLSSEDFEAYELGERSPSLPELEALSLLLDVPLGHFWEDQTIASSGDGRKQSANAEQIIKLRQRVIGALLRKMRLEAGLSPETLAERAYSSPTLLESYELGEAPIPLPDLEVLSTILQHPLTEFQEQRGIVGAGADQHPFVQDFLELSPELQSFVSKPVNRPYLELAKRLSEMDVKKLREVAEGLLEITL